MKNLILLIFFVFFISCAQKSKEIVTKIESNDLDEQMINAYNEGLSALERGDVLFATKKFNEAELLYPQSDWAPRASLMAAYAYWTQNYFSNSVNELDRFIKLYPKNKNLDYAYYLLAMNYYDSIVDEKKDLRPLLRAREYFNFIIQNYPQTDYALDGKYKIELIEEMLAAKEMYIARHYMKKEKWIAAVNRLKFVINEYETSIYVEEALHRLVEVYYILGLENEAKKYAQTLGYNYQSSEWYKKTYKIFNQDYKVSTKVKNRKNKKLIDRIKSFF